MKLKLIFIICGLLILFLFYRTIKLKLQLDQMGTKVQLSLHNSKNYAENKRFMLKTLGKKFDLDRNNFVVLQEHNNYANKKSLLIIFPACCIAKTKELFMMTFQELLDNKKMFLKKINIKILDLIQENDMNDNFRNYLDNKNISIWKDKRYLFYNSIQYNLNQPAVMILNENEICVYSFLLESDITQNRMVSIAKAYMRSHEN